MAEWSIFGKREQRRPEEPRPFLLTREQAAAWADYENERQHKEFARWLLEHGRLNERDDR